MPHISHTFYDQPKCKVQNEVESDVTDGTINYDSFNKIYMLGEKSTSFKITGPLQSYEKLKQHHIQNKTLFSDVNFPAETIELTKLPGEVVWKRPFEICGGRPQFIVDGATRFDIDQGQLGDCWFLAAIANLTADQKLFSMVVPTNQSFTDDYAGIFHFRFWQYGRWVDVVIDDRLPTIDNELIYLRSATRNEFWPPLLEKAYAKFYGSYKNIEGGHITEALEDLCGGLSEVYKADHPQIFEIMEMSYQRSSFMGCSIISSEREGRRSDGLVTTHAYSITAIKTLQTENETRLIRIRNPWGNSTEWNGAWSDNSNSWDSVSEETKEDLLVNKADGEFWIEIGDFQRCFTFVDICHLNPSAFIYSDDRQNWNVHMFEGSWVPHITAGGGCQYKDTYANNPQYFMSIRRNNTQELYHVVIGLLQKDRRELGEGELPLELDLYQVQTQAGELLEKSFFEANEPILHKSEVGVRQLTVRVLLPPGKYCIIPNTRLRNIYASYLLRIYSESGGTMMEGDDEIGYKSDAIMTNPGTQVQVADGSWLRVFRKVSNRQKEIGWYCVQRALNDYFGKRSLLCFLKPKVSFSKDTSKNIVALWDTDYSGKLSCDEFGRLMEDIAALKIKFKEFDVDHSGKLSGFELRNLLATCGYKVNKQILVILMLRYGYNGSMNFEKFVLCVFKLKAMIDEFSRRESIQNNNQISLNRSDWLQTILYS